MDIENMTDLRTAQAKRAEVRTLLAAETDAEMRQFYTRVIDQWTIEIGNIRRRRYRAYRQALARVFGWLAI